MQNYAAVEKARAFIEEKTAGKHPAKIGIILGTGLGEWAEKLPWVYDFDYEEIPGFVPSGVMGHAGKFIATEFAGKNVWMQLGRFHLYEGHTASQVCMGVRTMASLGVKTLIITNAAGAIDPRFQAGRLMLIKDHINFTGQNPLIGVNVDEWGERFPDMSAVYDKKLQDLACEKALKLGIALDSGVYLGLTGPSLETPAETRAFIHMGAHAVGMSTVLEVIAAHHMGLRVLGLSCLTNKNIPDCMEKTTLDEVVAMALRSGNELSRLLKAIVAELEDQNRL